MPPTTAEQLAALDISLGLVRQMHDRVIADGLDPELTLGAIAVLTTIKQTIERQQPT